MADHTPSDGSKATTAASTAVTVLAIVAVVLRFWTRRIIKAGFGWDDWWILIGTLLLLVTGGTLLYGVKSDPEGGEMIDRDSPTFNYAPHVTYLKISFTSAILYFSIVTAIKLSILLFYRRIFNVSSFRVHSLIVGAVVLVWWLVGTIATMVSCIPIERLWVGPSAGGYCFNFNIYWMVMGAVELIIDSYILVLPIRMVLNLQLSRKNKILLCGIFLLGGFVIITGLLRVVYGYKPGSQNVAFAKAETWSAVHIGIAIVCACLPTYRPLFARAAATFSSFRRHYYGSGSRTEGSNTRSKSSGKVDVLPLKNVSSRGTSANDPHGDTERLTDTGNERNHFSNWEIPAPGTIAVESRIDVERS